MKTIQQIKDELIRKEKEVCFWEIHHYIPSGLELDYFIQRNDNDNYL